MLMSYLGTVKSLLLKPILLSFGSSAYAMRVPAVLAGAASIWVFYHLLRRIAGERAALIGCSLLAVDSSYLVTTVFDWGPVALQHLLMLGGTLLLVRFYQQREEWTLAAGFFLFGLVLWDKALALWMLSGMAVAAAVLFPRKLLSLVTRRRIAVTFVALCLGALPLLIYNASSHWGTFRGNVHRDFHDLPGKARLLRDTEARGLFGWLTAESWRTPKPHEPAGAVQKASARLAKAAGEPQNFILLYGFVLALLLAPLAGPPGWRAMAFCLITGAVAWIQMASNAATGGSVHHTILLWPLPEAVIAISFAAASQRLGRAGIPAIVTAMAVLLASGALVVNQYYVELWRYGGGQSWNEGIYYLSAYAKDHPAKMWICLDWGFLDPLRFLHHGKLQVAMGNNPVDDHDEAIALFSDPENVFLSHTKDYAFFPETAPAFFRFAQESGYHRVVVATIGDSYGRQFCEISRFERAP